MPQDIIDEIITDHREVEDLFAQIEDTGNPLIQQGLVEHVITELVRHAVAEEQFLYPTARKALSDGDELADHELTEHAMAEELMTKLEKALHEGRAGTAKFNQMVRTLMEEVRHHVSEEEAVLLPELRKACDPGDLAELGRKFDNAKKTAPTRPHPSAPDRPPANKILGPGVGLIDRMRDALTGRRGHSSSRG